MSDSGPAVTRLIRATYAVCAAASTASIIWWMVLIYLCVSAPLNPDVASDQIVPFNNHGTIHYITALQDFCLHWQIPLTLPIMMLASFIEKRHAWVDDAVSK